MPTLALVRHGQSLWNLENRFTGWVDVPLTDKGRDEALAYKARPVWTANYRGVLSFDECRRAARAHGLSTPEDWDELGVPQYMPRRPENMFPDEWLGWDDWLGTSRPVAEAARVAATLGIASELDWCNYAIDNPGVIADLRLPVRPSVRYGAAFPGFPAWLQGGVGPEGDL